MEPITYSDEGGRGRVRIERTASGKLVKMITVEAQATVEEISAMIDLTVSAFRYLEAETARRIDGADVPPAPKPAG